MLSGLHILLTYTCPFKCDHCFLYCSPTSPGTFSIGQLRALIDQAAEMESITSISFEGGEPLLFLPTMIAGITYAKEKGFSTGVVTNGYQARSPEDARLLMNMLREAGLDSLTISDDVLHYGSTSKKTPAAHLFEAAQEIGCSAHILSVELPSDGSPTGGVMFRGRAADTMTEGLPRSPWQTFVECPHENPLDPSRVHIDCYGNIHFCQGIVIGNVWEESLTSLFDKLDLTQHPICGPLARGGPASLASGLETDDGYVDACHLCFEARRRAMHLYPDILTPAQVYGISRGKP